MITSGFTKAFDITIQKVDFLILFNVVDNWAAMPPRPFENQDSYTSSKVRESHQKGVLTKGLFGFKKASN